MIVTTERPASSTSTGGSWERSSPADHFPSTHALAGIELVESIHAPAAILRCSEMQDMIGPFD